MTIQWDKIKEWPELLLEKMEDADVARITLNRPDKRNAQNLTMVQAFLDALEVIRGERELKVIITRGAGKSFSAGLDLHYLHDLDHEPLRDFDRPALTTHLVETMIDFPRITIAQVHGYAVGGSMALMNVHDLIVAADDAQIGMPEVPRGSFGEMATSTLFHAQIPLKKAALIALSARNVSGAEADRLGLVSMSVPPADLEAKTNELARQIAANHIAPLQHHKIAVQMGRNMSLREAIRLDQLVGERQSIAIDPTGDVEGWLKSQKGGPNAAYKRSDVK